MYIQSGELVTILGGKISFRQRSFRSLRVRIIILLAIFGMIPCILIKTVILESYEDRAVSVKTAEIQNQCTILSNQLCSSNYLANPTSEILNAEMTQLTNIYNGRVMIIDKNFHVVKDTYHLDEGKTIVSEDVIKCYKGRETSQYDGKNRYIEVTEPIMDSENKNIMGVMLVSISTDIIVDNQDVLESKANVIQTTIIVVLLIVACFIASILVRPFGRITKVIEDVTEGYDDDNLHENAYTETKLISDAFNKMLGRLKVVDDSRQEFVSNVSHELKTPLTSMKVLADSLLTQPDAPVELYQEFMGDITEEIERENKIINDLLSLVKMDKTAAGVNIKAENINDVVERILKRLRPIAAARNIEVVFESFRPVTAEVDEVKLSLALSNLVENAIKYNSEDGWVHVSLNADHKYFYIKVADSGMGIPKEEQEHIFERFYRVDKSHSREIGGTGLGLAITRNAIVVHRGAIKVFSEEGEGTTFTVRIPLNYIV
ncbi:MAG: HAMP domain-containing sensor histidine kinase [Lachnospiraceae bacterium]